MDKKIAKLLERYKEDWDRATQRTELIKRNEDFLKELKDVEKELGGNLSHFFKAYKTSPKVRIYMDVESKAEEKKLVKEMMESFEKAGNTRLKEAAEFSFREKYWREFCDRWHLDPRWNGRLGSLKKYIKAPIELRCLEDREKKLGAILIMIDNWTILDDIKAIWGMVEKYQNKLWKKREKLSKFMRDIVWYDLHKKHKLKYREIAEIWDKSFPEEVDSLHIKNFRKDIDTIDLEEKELDDDTLIHELKSGFLSEKYGKYYKESRTYYSTGRLSQGKFQAPFAGTIRRAIERIEDQVEQMSSSYYVSFDIISQMHRGTRYNGVKIINPSEKKET